MKTCRRCRARVPDATHRCPHCRRKLNRADRMPQAVIAGVTTLATALAWFATCAGLQGQAAGAPERGGAPTVTRLRYDGGGDWYANPSSLVNLLREIGLRTGLEVGPRPDEAGANDPDLGDHPYLYATGHGNMAFSDLEVERLRAHLLAGGFLHVDDNYGLDESFRREVERLFPDQTLAEVPLDHPIYRLFYEFPDGLPKIHEHDGEPAQGFGIFLDGRLAVFYSFQSDLGDGWEDEGVHEDAPEVREAALRMGVNLFLYALSATSAR